MLRPSCLSDARLSADRRLTVLGVDPQDRITIHEEELWRGIICRPTIVAALPRTPVTAWGPALPLQQRRAVQPRKTCIRSKRKRYCVQRQPPGTTQPGLVTTISPDCALAWMRSA
jgi:hypothetical protein